MAKSRCRKKSWNWNRRIIPRIGNEYQPEITPLMETSVSTDSTIDTYSSFENLDTGLTPTRSWTEVEKDNFVLGLYFFGKKLDVVKKFMDGNVGMGDILSYYHGDFYNSIAYHTIKSQTSAERLSIASRHEKLLARLYPLVSKDVKDKLIEISDNFSNQKLLYEAYVFALKEIVGVETLVKVVRIGRRKLKKSTSCRAPATVTDHCKTPPCERPSLVVETYNDNDDDNGNADLEAVNENESLDDNTDNGNAQPSETVAKVPNRPESNGVAAEESQPKKMLSFDLNIRFVLSDTEDEGGDDLRESQDVTKTEEPLLSGEEKNEAGEDHQANNGPRRSLRDRPMTKRAFEALENEFVNSNKRRN